MALTDSRIKSLKPRATRYLVSDGRGLALDVTPAGYISWLFRYRLEGKQYRVTLGRYPDLTLKAARDKRDGLAAQVSKGISPAVEARLARQGKLIDPSVRQFGERYYAEQVLRNRKDPSQIRRYLDNEIYPAMGEKLLNTVTVVDVQTLVYRKRDGGHVQAAIQLRSVLKDVRLRAA